MKFLKVKIIGRYSGKMEFGLRSLGNNQFYVILENLQIFKKVI